MGRELTFISRGEGTRTGVGRDADGTDERSASLLLVLFPVFQLRLLVLSLMALFPVFQFRLLVLFPVFCSQIHVGTLSVLTLSSPPLGNRTWGKLGDMGNTRGLRQLRIGSRWRPPTRELPSSYGKIINFDLTLEPYFGFMNLSFQIKEDFLKIKTRALSSFWGN